MNTMTVDDILRRHERSLMGTLKACNLPSDALGLEKAYYVYEPPGLNRQEGVPLLFLFRGHEREWVNIHEDTSRHLSTAIEDLDTLIHWGEVPPLIAVMPGLSSNNNHVPALGVDMGGIWSPHLQGLGHGRYWQYLTGELFPAVEAAYPQADGGLRLTAGFSLGGYTVSLLALHHPGYFQHAACYDALFMWRGHQDPRPYEDGTHTDRVWWRNPLFTPAFGWPRDTGAMQLWNPTDTLAEADDHLLDQVRRTTFWIAGADADGNRGNRDRCAYLADMLSARGVPLGYEEIVFAPHAAHNWHWNDLFLARFLRNVFRP